MSTQPTMMESLHGVSEGINDTVAGGIRGLAWNAQPIMRAMSVPYIALGAFALADGEIVTGIGLIGVGALSTRVRIPRINRIEEFAEVQPIEQPLEVREDTKKYVEELQLDQLRRHLRRTDRPWEDL